MTVSMVYVTNLKTPWSDNPTSRGTIDHREGNAYSRGLRPRWGCTAVEFKLILRFESAWFGFNP
jgi:hypothetical protein